MCDCYEAKCQECSELIPVHIKDFCMPRENLQVFCEKHLPNENIYIFTVTEKKQLSDDPPKGTRWGFRILDYSNCRYKTEPWDWATPNIAQRTKCRVITYADNID